MLPRHGRPALEAENGPEGPLYTFVLLKKIWSGRRDSNP
jgi:hypothetical protein